jgi:ubiquinone/menaquinone biosynthesis C-methylase UbiE
LPLVARDRKCWNTMRRIARYETGDRHIPTFLTDNFLRRLVSPPKKKLSKFISAGVAVADVGCGPGHFTIPMAELVGPEGKVYAADSDPRSIQVLKAKLEGRELQRRIQAETTSAANLEFIPDASVDFAFANGVLCCMMDHAGAVTEIKRILKPQGLAYIGVAKSFRNMDPRAVTREEWKRILESFKIRENGEVFMNRWAIVSLKDRPSPED